MADSSTVRVLVADVAPSVFRLCRMSDYEVRYSELRQAAGQLTTVQQQAQGLLATLSSVSLGASDFGRGPGMGGMYPAYVQHTRDGKDSLEQVADSMGRASAGLQTTADMYEQMEQQAQQIVEQYFGSAL